MTSQFTEIVTLIQRSRNAAQRMVNVEMINLYWQVGEYIHRKISTAAWGDGAVKELADFIGRNHPELKGFGLRALYKMRQFYETYIALLPSMHVADNQTDKIVPSAMAQFKDIRNTLLTKISWTHHLTLLERVRKIEELDFYLHLSIKENYSVKELQRQIKSSLFERVMLSNHQLPEAVKESQHVASAFKDRYVFEFLNLP